MGGSGRASGIPIHLDIKILDVKLSAEDRPGGPMARRTENDDRIDRLLAEWRAERPELDAAAMAVVGRLLSIGRQLEARANAALRPLGLHYTDLDVLATLRRGGRPYRRTPTELRDSVLITSGAMTACLDRLERNGLITRIADPKDRRSSAAALTREGRALIDKAIAVRFAEAADALSGLSAADGARLAVLLKKLGRTLGAPAGEGTGES
ncbi:DNA-binding MarR family transcriptional regulator [Dokdonella fugitiva]|uniref:DNA-binding MarR family transcriptional regulator n=1 Tax=Dokdonella fugitiva TaxID=328517 RepID=A0A839EQS1_9GAMM|nr:MarR family transcriptional regulator [Dokdonella fugitiva]MBA8886095.1 DNA-binding MarR family transcriptional regulator [Dokdonella fugitiva]